MFIGSFTEICLGLLEAFLYPCFFFRTYPVTRERILKIYLEFSPGVISLSRTFCPIPSEFDTAGPKCASKVLSYEKPSSKKNQVMNYMLTL